MYEVLLFAGKIFEKTFDSKKKKKYYIYVTEEKLKKMAKKIILKNEKIWYHSSKQTGYIPIKDNSKYGFRDELWQKGFIIDEIVDENTCMINRAADKTSLIYLQQNHHL